MWVKLPRKFYLLAKLNRPELFIVIRLYPSLLFSNVKIDWNSRGYIIFDIWHPN